MRRNLRHIVEVEDVEQMIHLYNNGMSMSKIAYALNFSETAVRSVIKNHTGKYLDKIVQTPPDHVMIKDPVTGQMIQRRKTEKEIASDVIYLYDNGLSIPKILSRMKGVCNSEVKQILVDAGRIDPDDETHKTITVEGIDDFIKTIHPGDKFKVNMTHGGNGGKTITVDKKYKRFITTTTGESFMYVDLYVGKKITNEK